jgi:hypothetical protein
MGGTCSTHRADEKCTQNLSYKKLERKEVLGRIRSEKNHSNKIDLKEIGYEDVYWIRQMASCCECGDEPCGFMKRGEFLYYLCDH